MPSGDPEGKRLARVKAQVAEEALELMQAIVPRFATLGEEAVIASLESLRRDVRRIHGAESGRSGGHLEPRRKYRGRSTHLALEQSRGVVTLYLDESGQSNPTLESPLFVLAGIAMDEEAAREYVLAADALKSRFGLNPKVCLHAPQIEKGVDDFSFGDNPAIQAEFRSSVDELVRTSRFQLLGAILRKDVLAQSGEVYGNLPAGLYEMALMFVAERFVDALHADQVLKPCGRLVFESIGNREDALHQRAFADLLVHGSEFVSDGCFRGWLKPGCEFRAKGGSHPLELADLAARALLTWARDGMPEDHPFWARWADQIAHRAEPEKAKFGLKVFPDGDIRATVLAMRRRVAGREG